MQKDPNHYYVYICGGEPGNNLQIGTSADLNQHLKATRQNTPADPSKLVYYEHYDREAMALAREKQFKENSPNDNQRLIESMNPNWLDLSDLL